MNDTKTALTVGNFKNLVWSGIMTNHRKNDIDNDVYITQIVVCDNVASAPDPEKCYEVVVRNIEANKSDDQITDQMFTKFCIKKDKFEDFLSCLCMEDRP